jgi:hypothetical protein
VSTLAVDAQPRARRLWLVAVSSDAISIAAISAAFAVLTVLTWHTWGDLGRDTGYDLVAGARVAHGQLPYVDFVYYYGPLAPMLMGLAALVGGTGLAPAVGLGLAIAYAIVLAVYALARTQSGPLGAALAAAITAGVAFSPTNFSFVLPHTYSATLAVLMTLGFLLALHRAEVTARDRWLVAAGVLAGLAALTRPEFAAAVLVGGALWLWARRQAGARGLRTAGLLIAPAVLVPAAVYGAFLTSISPHRLLFDNLYPVAQLHAAGNAVLRIDAPLTPGSFALLGLRLCLYAAGVALLLLIARAIEAPGTARKLTVPLLVAGAAAAVAFSVLRSETLRYGLEFAYGWIPAGAALATILLAYRVRRSRSASDSVALACAAVLTVLAAKSYGGFFLHASRAQAAVYAAPFAAVLLARLHLSELGRSRAAFALGAAWLAFLAAAGAGLALKDARAESGLVTGPGGTLAATPSDAPVYQSAVSWITSQTRPGEPILLAPQLTALYTLSGRQDPLPQLSILPGALPTPQSQSDAIVTLEKSRVRLAIVDRRAFSEYGQGAFGVTFDRTLAAWIDRQFRHVATLGSPGTRVLDVWLKRRAS